ncbi:MAG: hypothetical protein AAF416_06705 [Pseudomonadota bacterium]
MQPVIALTLPPLAALALVIALAFLLGTGMEAEAPQTTSGLSGDRVFKLASDE